MTARLQTRLSLNFLLVLCLGLGLASALVWLTVEKLYLDTQRENLLAQAQITASALQGQPLENLASRPYTQTTNTIPGIHTHIFDNLDAVVLQAAASASASQSLPLVENNRSGTANDLRLRPEVQSALNGVPSTYIRKVPTAANRRVLYAAAPVYASDGSLSGIVYLATPLPASGLPASALFQMAVIILLAAAVALALAFLLSRRIARPVESIAAAAGRVAEGDLGQKVAVSPSVRELDSLAASFNRMVAGLQESDRAKTAFVADVTHELRTPLTVIKGTIETLEDGALDDPEGRGPLLASMQRETERLIRLVNELLVLTRADAGMLKLDLRPLDLAGLARRRCELLSAMAAARGVTLQVATTGPVAISGDADRLAQVLDNLLDNAIRYSSPGSFVLVSFRQEGQLWHGSVQDSGCGIPAGHLPHIFERFYRVEASRDRRSGGSGLGLAIVKALLQAHHGTVAAESTEGHGTTITFTLPAASGLPPS